MNDFISNEDKIRMTGGPAFPSEFEADFFARNGMSLRDYFAAAAMQGIVAGCGNAMGQVSYDDTTLTRNAYILADKMLEARAAKPQEQAN